MSQFDNLDNLFAEIDKITKTGKIPPPLIQIITTFRAELLQKIKEIREESPAEPKIEKEIECDKSSVWSEIETGISKNFPEKLLDSKEFSEKILDPTLQMLGNDDREFQNFFSSIFLKIHDETARSSQDFLNEIWNKIRTKYYPENETVSQLRKKSYEWAMLQFLRKEDLISKKQAREFWKKIPHGNIFDKNKKSEVLEEALKTENDGSMEDNLTNQIIRMTKNLDENELDFWEKTAQNLEKNHKIVTRLKSLETIPFEDLKKYLGILSPDGKEFQVKSENEETPNQIYFDLNWDEETWKTKLEKTIEFYSNQEEKGRSYEEDYKPDDVAPVNKNIFNMNTLSQFSSVRLRWELEKLFEEAQEFDVETIE